MATLIWGNVSEPIEFYSYHGLYNQVFIYTYFPEKTAYTPHINFRENDPLESCFFCIPFFARRRRRQTLFFIAYSNFLSFFILLET